MLRCVNATQAQRPWLCADDTLLRELWNQNAPWKELCAKLSRAKSAIMHRRDRLGGFAHKKRVMSPAWLAKNAKRLKETPPHRGHATYPVIVREGIPSKCCSKCQIWKPVAAFGKASNGASGGIRSICTPCAVAYQRTRSAENLTVREAGVAKTLRWQHKNPVAVRQHRQAARHKRRELVDSGSGVTTQQWRAILAQFDGMCVYCKVASGKTMDHVIPLSRGGPHDAANVVPACRSCNSSKGSSTLEEWAARRKATPEKAE